MSLGSFFPFLAYTLVPVQTRLISEMEAFFWGYRRK